MNTSHWSCHRKVVSVFLRDPLKSDQFSRRLIACLKFSHLLAVLQLLHPETSSLEAAAVRQVWGNNNTVRLLDTRNDREVVHYKRFLVIVVIRHATEHLRMNWNTAGNRKCGFTVADDGCSRSSVVDSAHSFVSLRPGRVLSEMDADRSENQLPGMSAEWNNGESVEPRKAVGKIFFIYELTQIPNVMTLSPTWIGLATNAAPIVCREKQTKAGKLQKRCKVGSLKDGGAFCLSFSKIQRESGCVHTAGESDF